MMTIRKLIRKKKLQKKRSALTVSRKLRIFYFVLGVTSAFEDDRLSVADEIRSIDPASYSARKYLRERRELIERV